MLGMEGVQGGGEAGAGRDGWRGRGGQGGRSKGGREGRKKRKELSFPLRNHSKGMEYQREGMREIFFLFYSVVSFLFLSYYNLPLSESTMKQSANTN